LDDAKPRLHAVPKPDRSLPARQRFVEPRGTHRRLRKIYLIKKFCQSLGLASLILVMNYGDLLGGGADVRMHVPFALTNVVWAQIADIFLLGLLIFAVLAPFKRTRYHPIVKLLVAIVAPPYLIERLRAEIPYPLDSGLLVLGGIVWAAILLLLLLKFSSLYRRLIRFGDAVGIFFAVFALTSVLQLLYVLHWKPGPHQHTVAWATTPQPPREHPLVVWVIFDELSYDQVFEHRAHDLALPNFDALRSQSTVFSNAQPIGYKTVKVIPSLLTGHQVDDYRFNFDNSLKVHYTGQHGFQKLDGSSTVFADAQQAGWRTAVVGWYNPYCTIYAGAIDDCYWMNLDRIDGDMAQQASIGHNIYAPLQQVVREVKAPERADRDSCNYDVRQRLKTHLDLQAHAMDLLKRDQADFVFLHMSVPHSPNIWSRIDDNYTTFCDSSYLDNLALADRVLGNIMKNLQSSPRWKDTTVIVEGDHSWRINLWNWLPAWTDEDDAASRNGFDPRPALIIHQAGQTAPAVNATPYSLLNVHSVAEQVIHGQPVKF
jgi:hypothetical protein